MINYHCIVHFHYGFTCNDLFVLFLFTQKAIPPVESDASAEGNSQSSSVEVMVDSAPVIKDKKVRMPLHHQSSRYYVIILL